MLVLNRWHSQFFHNENFPLFSCMTAVFIYFTRNTYSKVFGMLSSFGALCIIVFVCVCFFLILSFQRCYWEIEQTIRILSALLNFWMDLPMLWRDQNPNKLEEFMFYFSPLWFAVIYIENEKINRQISVGRHDAMISSDSLVQAYASWVWNSSSQPKCTFEMVDGWSWWVRLLYQKRRRTT